MEAKFLGVNTRLDEFGIVLRNVQASIQSLETQVGQLAKANSKWPPGSLPSNSKDNPREHLKAITLRNGKQLEERAKEGPITTNEKVTIQEDLSLTEKLPYSSRLMQDKEDAKFKKFLNIFKQLHINIPLVEALLQIPKYAKFMKDLLTNKMKLEELETMTLSTNCSAVIQKKLSKKLIDPNSFIIPGVIGE
ncbi:uncharacterized protein LOC120273169 [Dioscorea cayenensis subsp. rotundata]|uniref:Uncharacterized protein LOC120273169 n=1 Tax=Dioscorea cayennensis subsp. rotundata TaxID=55577 RepID=A0AB40C7E2_DIOCR|nr:uncharacterized protein LOC120273169 [Dioscorea cayenensis subsp. rotundata]